MAHTTISHRDSILHGIRSAPVFALMFALVLLGNTRAFDGLRAASYFLRARKGSVVALTRPDQEVHSQQDRNYVFARARVN